MCDLRLLFALSIVWSLLFETARAQPGPAFASSVEHAANNAAVVMLARVIEVEDTDESEPPVTVFAIDETLKGMHKERRQLKVLQPAKVVRLWKDETRQVLVTTYDGDVALTAIDLDSNTLAEFTADLTLLTKPEEVIRCFREAIRRSPGITRMLSIGLKATADMSRRAEKWRIRAEGVIVSVPVDEALEQLARKFVLSADYQQRCDGVRALQFFRSDENIARAKELLADPGYSVNRPAEHNDGVEQRVFGVRNAAYETLKYWGIAVEKPTLHAEVRVEGTKNEAARKDEAERRENGMKWSARRIASGTCVMRVMVPEASSNQDLPLDAVIENRGSRRVKLGETGYFLDCKVTLKTKAGTDIPYKTLGRYVFGEPPDRHQYGVPVLSSGQARSWQFNLAEAFEPLAPGEYLLTLKAKVTFEDKNARADMPESKKFTERVELVVEDLAFEVLAKEAAKETAKEPAPREDVARVPREVVERVKAECGWAGFSHRREQRGLRVLEHFQTISEDDLAALRELTDVTDIALEGGFSERGIAHLRGLEHIEFVYLHWSTEISDGVLVTLATLPNLRELHLQNSDHRRITQRGIDALAKLTKLERLSLQGLPITDADMRHIAAMPNLRVLRLSSRNLTKAGVEHLQGLKNLRVLALDGCPIGDKGLEAIAPMHKLERLSLGRVGIKGDGLSHLSGLLNLNWLCLPGNEIEDGDIEALKPLGKLKQLDLAGNPITDESVAALAAFRRLEFIRFERTKITDEGIARFEKASPGKVTKATSICDVDRD